MKKLNKLFFIILSFIYLSSGISVSIAYSQNSDKTLESTDVEKSISSIQGSSVIVTTTSNYTYTDESKETKITNFKFTLKGSALRFLDKINIIKRSSSSFTVENENALIKILENALEEVEYVEEEQSDGSIESVPLVSEGSFSKEDVRESLLYLLLFKRGESNLIVTTSRRFRKLLGESRDIDEDKENKEAATTMVANSIYESRKGFLRLSPSIVNTSTNLGFGTNCIRKKREDISHLNKKDFRSLFTHIEINHGLIYMPVSLSNDVGLESKSYNFTSSGDKVDFNLDDIYQEGGELYGVVEKRYLVNIFGEVIATLYRKDARFDDNGDVVFIHFVEKFAPKVGKDFILSWKDNRCAFNEIMEYKNKMANCRVCRYMITISNSMISSSEKIYNLTKKRLLYLAAIFLGIWLVYEFLKNMTGAPFEVGDFKSFSDNAYKKMFKVIVCMSVLFVNPRLLMTYTVDPIVYLGAGIGQKLISSADRLQDASYVNSNIGSDSTALDKFVCSPDLILRRYYEKIQLDKEDNEYSLLYPETKRVLKVSELEDPTKSLPGYDINRLLLLDHYMGESICLIYAIKDYNAKQSTIGWILWDFGSRKLTESLGNLLLKFILPIVILYTVFGMILTNPIAQFFLTLGGGKIYKVIFDRLLNISGIIQDILYYSKVLVLGFLVRFIFFLFNFVAAFYIIDALVGIGLAVVMIPIACVLWIFDYSGTGGYLKSLLGKVEDAVISMVAVSVFAVFIIMLFEYIYEGFFGLNIDLIDKAFLTGNKKYITDQLSKEHLNIKGFDMILVVATVIYIADNIGNFINAIQLNRMRESMVKNVITITKNTYNKLSSHADVQNVKSKIVKGTVNKIRSNKDKNKNKNKKKTTKPKGKK